MQPVDEIGLHATLARIRELTTPVVPALAAPGQPPAPAQGTGFAQQLAQAQTANPGALAQFVGQQALPGGAAQSLSLGSPFVAGPPPAGLSRVAALPGVGAQPVPGAPAGTTTGTAGPQGQRIAQIAAQELGVREEPSGSNDGRRIAEYRTATHGAGVGPWCSYFTSWVAAQAGVPVGPDGRGEGWVPNVERWGKQTGRWIGADSSTRPQAGDLVVFDRNGDGLTDHIGVVTGIRPDGGITTVEGNSSNAVSARSYDPGGWTGVVRLVAPGA